MRTILHVLTRPDDRLAIGMAELQRQDVENKTETVDLTRDQPDYHLLLQKIFAADSIQVW